MIATSSEVYSPHLVYVMYVLRLGKKTNPTIVVIATPAAKIIAKTVTHLS